MKFFKKYEDKIQHFIVSAILVMVISFFKGIAIGVCAALLIGLLKEFIYDYSLKLGCCDKYDVYANTIGVIFGVIILKLIGV